MRKSLFPLGTFSLIFLLFLAGSCQQQGVEEVKEMEPATEVEADFAAFDEILNQYAIGCNTGDFDLWMSLWTDDAIKMPPDMPALIGKEEIRAKMKSLFDQFTLKIDIKNEETKLAGDWAYVRGNYTLSTTPKTGGETTHVEGKYLSILQRQEDGSWKIARDCYNFNAPPSSDKE